MKAQRLICPGVRQIEVEEFELDNLPDDGILVQNQLTAVSIGTELWGWTHGSEPGRGSAFPRTTGYCSTGVVLEVGKDVTDVEVREALAEEIATILSPVAKPLEIGAGHPHVILFAGVNGSGKTTTIGKLAKRFKDEGKSVMLAAGDTFRAAAIGQLATWADQINPSFRSFDASYVDAVHDAGMEVHTYTVNERDDMHLVLDRGVDGVITNFPDVLEDVFAERRTRADAA